MIADGAAQPVPCSLGEDLRLRDCEGNQLLARVTAFRDPAAVLEYRLNRSLGSAKLQSAQP